MKVLVYHLSVSSSLNEDEIKTAMNNKKQEILAELGSWVKILMISQEGKEKGISDYVEVLDLDYAQAPNYPGWGGTVQPTWTSGTTWTSGSGSMGSGGGGSGWPPKEPT